MFLLTWWKERRERKANNIRAYAEKLLAEADKIYTVAKAMHTLVSDSSGIGNIRTQASILWKSGSCLLLLNNWELSAWVLDKNRNTRSLRKSFEDAVDGICEKAAAWHEADMKWRKSVGIIESECLIGGDTQRQPTKEDIAKNNAVRTYCEAFDAFLKEHQAIHNSLQPLLTRVSSLK